MRIVAAAAFPVSSERTATIKCDSLRPKSCIAASKPMPVLLPVTTAVCPDKSVFRAGHCGFAMNWLLKNVLGKKGVLEGSRSLEPTMVKCRFCYLYLCGPDAGEGKVHIKRQQAKIMANSRLVNGLGPGLSLTNKQWTLQIRGA